MLPKSLSGNKKGVVFTTLAILISIVLVTSFFFLQDVPLDFESERTSLKLATTNSFILSTQGYVSNLVLLSSRQGLVDMVEIMFDEEEYYVDFDSEFRRCLLEGEVNIGGGSESCSSEAYLVGQIDAWNDFVFQNVKINSEIEILDLDIAQETPWEIEIFATYNLVASDDFGSWNITDTVSTQVPIFGLKDPIYGLVHSDYSSYRDTNQIIAQRQDFNLWQETPSSLHLTTVRGTYFDHPMGISYLNRLRNNITSDDAGIISIVPGDRPSSDTIFIDAYYYNQECYSGNVVRFDFWNAGMTENFRSQLEVNASVTGLNASVLPVEIADYANMTSSQYRIEYSISCP